MGKALGWIDSHCHLTCADLILSLIHILLLFVKIMKIWANDRDLTFALALLSPFSMKFMASRDWLWTDVSVAFCLTWTLCGILLFVPVSYTHLSDEGFLLL